MAHNTCTPSRIYGGEFRQTIFLGCSVMSFNASIGWGGQSGECTIQLVYDPCPPEAGVKKVYYDAQLVEYELAGPDPGFIEPLPGEPLYFRVGDFEYMGLCQSWDKQTGTNGEIYVVKLIDPTEIVSGIQLIISDYAGPVYDSNDIPANIINCYGYAESFGSPCPLTSYKGSVFGSGANAFGGSFSNDQGMPWAIIRDATSLLTSAFPPIANTYSPYGRILFRGGRPSNGGYGHLYPDRIDNNLRVAFSDFYPDGYEDQTWISDYFLDLSALPEAPSFYRMSGPSISLLDAIAQLCDDAGCDFYFELVPARVGDIIIKIIKVRTAYRGSQPDLNAVSQFLALNDKYVSKSVGKEMRNEPTGHLLFGGPVETVYQANEANLIKQYWGLDDNQNIIQEQTTTIGDTEYTYITVSVTDLNLSLETPLISNTVNIYIDELLRALVSKNVWEQWQDLIGTDLPNSIKNSLGFNYTSIFNLAFMVDVLTGPEKDKLTPRDLVSGTRERAFEDKTDPILKDMDKIFQFVHNIANEFYGRQFTVSIPYTCVRREDTSGVIVETDAPSDSGWTETSTVIGIPHFSLTAFFSDESLKIKPFVGYQSAESFDASEMSIDDYFIYNDNIYVRASLGLDTLVYENFVNKTNPKVVLTINTQLKMRESPTGIKAAAGGFLTNAKEFLRNNGAPAAAISNLDEMIKKAEAEMIMLPISNYLGRPQAAAVPMRNTTLTYGPWVIAGPPGKSVVSQDTDLVPWNYGSVANMQTAGESRVTEGLTLMQIGEMGAIEIPGLPAIGLGDELLFGAPTIIDTRNILTKNSEEVVDEDGEPLNNLYINTDETSSWIGIYGPNITNISCEISSAGITTNYSFRTYTPKYARFQRAVNEQLRKLAVNNVEIAKKLRQFQFDFLRIKLLSQKQALGAEARLEGDIHGDKGSPHGVLVGITQDSLTDGEKRTIVTLEKASALVNEQTSEYPNKAFMSLDGLLRPVSINGDGDLPEYVYDYEGGKNPSHPEVVEPPTKSYRNNTIRLDKLDFLKDDHDIDIVGHSDNLPESVNTHVTKALGDDPYQQDYRFLALRGPLVMTGYGYDLQGKPIPNEVDNEDDTFEGKFKNEGLKDEFLTDYKTKSHTWPVAPVDLRFDRKRGVWTSPPAYRIPIYELLEDMPSPTGYDNSTYLNVFQYTNGQYAWRGSPPSRAVMVNGPDMYDADGTKLPIRDEDKRVVYIHPIAGWQTARQGDRLMGYYDNVEDKHYCIEKASRDFRYMQMGWTIKDQSKKKHGGPPPHASTYYFQQIRFGGVSSNEGIAVGSMLPENRRYNHDDYGHIDLAPSGYAAILLLGPSHGKIPEVYPNSIIPVIEIPTPHINYLDRFFTRQNDDGTFLADSYREDVTFKWNNHQAGENSYFNASTTTELTISKDNISNYKFFIPLNPCYKNVDMLIGTVNGNSLTSQNASASEYKNISISNTNATPPMFYSVSVAGVSAFGMTVSEWSQTGRPVGNNNGVGGVFGLHSYGTSSGNGLPIGQAGGSASAIGASENILICYNPFGVIASLGQQVLIYRMIENRYIVLRTTTQLVKMVSDISITSLSGNVPSKISIVEKLLPIEGGYFSDKYSDQYKVMTVCVASTCGGVNIDLRADGAIQDLFREQASMTHAVDGYRVDAFLGRSSPHVHNNINQENTNNPFG